MDPVSLPRVRYAVSCYNSVRTSVGEAGGEAIDYLSDLT